jgi:putative FmdB family regulatory protein
MPMYDFDCDACGERFEALVSTDTHTTECPLCGSGETRRIISTFGTPWRFVKTPGAARQQEVRNAKLHSDTKARFKDTMRKVREAKKGGGQKQ